MNSETTSRLTVPSVGQSPDSRPPAGSAAAERDEVEARLANAARSVRRGLVRNAPAAGDRAGAASQDTVRTSSAQRARPIHRRTVADAATTDQAVARDRGPGEREVVPLFLRRLYRPVRWSFVGAPPWPERSSEPQR